MVPVGENKSKRQSPEGETKVEMFLEYVQPVTKN